MAHHTGIIALVRRFRQHLAKPEIKNRIAPLQLVGRLEDYLVKEFASFVLRESEGRRCCESNIGRRGQQKVDLALVRSTTREVESIDALIEAKYLQNRHGRSDHDGGANDELRTTLNGLTRQLTPQPVGRHGFHDVRLRARSSLIYGLVFGSYTRKRDEKDGKDDFFKLVLKTAVECRLRHHDLERPYLRLAYEDHVVTVLGVDWFVTLSLGLWKLTKTSGRRSA